MEPRDLFLARHGETDWNAELRWQGQTDVPLNAAGRAQAEALAARARAHGILAVVASDLSRARHTAEIVAAELGLAVALVHPGLRERRFGAFEGLTRAECEARYPVEWARYLHDTKAGPPGGESAADLLSRVGPVLAHVAAELPGPALVVTHGGVMRALLHAAPGAGAPAGSRRLPGGIPNGGLVRATLRAGRLVAARLLDG